MIILDDDDPRIIARRAWKPLPAEELGWDPAFWEYEELDRTSIATNKARQGEARQDRLGSVRQGSETQGVAVRGRARHARRSGG